MPATPTHGIRWPLATDTPDVPRDCQNLAEDTDSAITAYLAVHARGTLPSQSIPNGVVTLLAANTSAIGGITENADVFTLTATGYYIASFRVAIPSGTTNTRMYVSLEEGNGADHRSPFGYGENEASATGLLYSNGTNTVQMMIYQTTGAAVNVNTGSFAIKYLGV